MVVVGRIACASDGVLRGSYVALTSVMTRCLPPSRLPVRRGELATASGSESCPCHGPSSSEYQDLRDGGGARRTRGTGPAGCPANPNRT